MSDVSLTEAEQLKVRMKSNGDLIQRIDGSEVLVAHYDRTSGHLEFATKEYSVKLYNQVTAKIGTVGDGTKLSTLTIKSVGVRGEERVKPDGTKRPKMREEGDGTPEVVDWYIRHALTEAIIRYGIYTDAAGKPIRKQVQRVVEVVVDNRDGPENPVPTPVKGQSHEGGPISRRKTVVNVRSAIIARRATRYEDDEQVLADLGVDKLEALFLPNEVVGGFQPDDDFASEPVAVEGGVE